MRTLHVPFEDSEYQTLERWRKRIEKLAGTPFPSWGEFLLFLAQAKVPETGPSLTESPP